MKKEGYLNLDNTEESAPKIVAEDFEEAEITNYRKNFSQSFCAAGGVKPN